MAMDSGSLQSSSGGEEEYDSRGEFLGQFLSNSPLFDHNFQQSLNSQYNNNNNNNAPLVWPIGLRSEPNFGNSHQPLLHHHNNTNQPLVENTNVVGRSAQSQPLDQPKNNPKKRTRASRRAPTTVLTTDTTNFRQMVQEFTGIPAGPFSGGGGGSVYSRRLDLFSTAGSSMRTAANSDPLGPFRPAQHKALHNIIPSSSLDTNFQLTKQGQQSLFNMDDDQILTFQPLLLKNPLGDHEGNGPVFGSKTRGMDGMGISHEQESGTSKGFDENVDGSSWRCPN